MSKIYPLVLKARHMPIAVPRLIFFSKVISPSFTTSYNNRKTPVRGRFPAQLGAKCNPIRHKTRQLQVALCVSCAISGRSAFLAVPSRQVSPFLTQFISSKVDQAILESGKERQKNSPGDLDRSAGAKMFKGNCRTAHAVCRRLR